MMDKFRGMPVYMSLLHTVRHEDWSQVKSPSRARRRMKQGHRQRIRYLALPDPKVFVIDGTIHGHPETIRLLFEAAKEHGP
jgi:hypothetical protein